jgi:PAS domain-containing protein
VQKISNPLNLQSSKQALLDELSISQSKVEKLEASNHFKQELTQTLSAAIDIGYWEWDDVEDKPTYLSEEMAIILGLTPEALYELYQCEADYFPLVHPDDLALYCENLRAILKQNHPRGLAHTFDYRIIRPSGEIRYVRELEYGVLVEDGIAVKTFGAIQDITDHKESQLSLRNSEQNYGSLFTNLPQGVEVEDYSAVKKIVDQLLSEGIGDLKTYLSNQPELLRELVSKVRLVDANHAALELYRCSSLQQLANREADISSWWNDDWVDYYASEIASFTSLSKYHNSEISDTHADSSEFVTRIISTVVEGDEDTWKRVLNIHEDITVRRQTEEEIFSNQSMLERLVKDRTTKLETALNAIEQSEAFLAQCTEIASLGYAIWDSDLDRDITVSIELAIIHGLTIDEYLNTVTSTEKYLEFVVPDDREKYMNYENAFLSDHDDEIDSIEYRIMRTDGEIRYLQQRR